MQKRVFVGSRFDFHNFVGLRRRYTKLILICAAEERRKAFV